MNATRKIKFWLMHGYKITPLQALEKWGCMRLGARIYELRKEGFCITSTMVRKNGKTYAQYQMKGNEN